MQTMLLRAETARTATSNEVTRRMLTRRCLANFHAAFRDRKYVP